MMLMKSLLSGMLIAQNVLHRILVFNARRANAVRRPEVAVQHILSWFSQ